LICDSHNIEETKMSDDEETLYFCDEALPEERDGPPYETIEYPGYEHDMYIVNEIMRKGPGYAFYQVCNLSTLPNAIRYCFRVFGMKHHATTMLEECINDKYFNSLAVKEILQGTANITKDHMERIIQCVPVFSEGQSPRVRQDMDYAIGLLYQHGGIYVPGNEYLTHLANICVLARLSESSHFSEIKIPIEIIRLVAKYLH